MKPVLQTSFKRYEKKYMLSIPQYDALLEKLEPYMEPDYYGKTTNCSIYYDTDDWELARKNIEKPIYKEKLRVRSYGVPHADDPVYIEIKKKYDGVVYKRRISMPCHNAEPYLTGDLSLSPGNQISGEIEWFQKMHQSKPKVYIAYDRTSYAGRENAALRITFDRNIRFRDYALDLRKGDFGQYMLSPNQVLMEVKIPGTAPLWLAKVLSEVEARPNSFSKFSNFYKEYVMQSNRKGISYSA